jgi:hypothetical protein
MRQFKKIPDLIKRSFKRELCSPYSCIFRNILHLLIKFQRFYTIAKSKSEVWIHKMKSSQCVHLENVLTILKSH